MKRMKLKKLIINKKREKIFLHNLTDLNIKGGLDKMQTAVLKRALKLIFYYKKAGKKILVISGEKDYKAELIYKKNVITYDIALAQKLNKSVLDKHSVLVVIENQQENLNKLAKLIAYAKIISLPTITVSSFSVNKDLKNKFDYNVKLKGSDFEKSFDNLKCLIKSVLY